MTILPQDILCFFLEYSTPPQLTTLGEGNVNDTWLVKTRTGDSFVLQRLNSDVFPDPVIIQDNLATVLNHLRNCLQASQTRFSMPRLIPSLSGKHHVRDSDGNIWRMMSFIQDTCPLNRVTHLRQARELGWGLGLFHRLVADLVPNQLADPLPGFHVTPRYLKAYEDIAETTNVPDTACQEFIQKRRHDVVVLEREHALNTLGFQVIHGDPKVTNFLFNKAGKQVVSLIDLDTVRPGLLLHDIGDCLRSCCTLRGAGGQKDERVLFDRHFFSAMLKGYCSEAEHLLTSSDRQLIVESARIISLELGIRFYSDHLLGNIYFKITTPEQNLLRAKIQFALVSSIEEQYTELEEICGNILHTQTN